MHNSLESFACLCQLKNPQSLASVDLLKYNSEIRDNAFKLHEISAIQSFSSNI